MAGNTFHKNAFSQRHHFSLDLAAASLCSDPFVSKTRRSKYIIIPADF